MIQELYITAKQVGDEIIDISASVDSKMERWSDVSSRPNNLGITECVGFINKQAATAETDRLTLLVDVLAPVNKDEATLRIWAIESAPDENNTERSNNIQLDYAVNYDKARTVAKKGGDITRDDIRNVLHDQDTQLKRVIVSNQSGLDPASGQRLGERYDVTVDEADDIIRGKVSSALNAVTLTLKKSALAESNF